MSAISIGLIGVGRIGRMHAELLARRVPGAAVGIVYDVHAPFAADVAHELGVALAGSVEEVLASDVDAVAICSSADTHVDLMVAAAEAGKAVFCEKPVSLFLDELERGLGAIEAHGVPFQVGFNRRFDPAHASVAEAVAAGRIGEPLPRADLQPRPRAAVAGVRAHLRRPVPGHDDPRLRHGPVRHRLRGRGGVRPGRRASGARARGGRRHRYRAGDAGACQRLPDRDRQLPGDRLRLRPARRGLRLTGDGGVGEPARPQRRAHHRRTAPAGRPSLISSSSATCPATNASGRRSSGPCRPGPRHRSAPRTPGLRWSSDWPRCRSLREGRAVRLEEVTAPQ